MTIENAETWTHGNDFAYTDHNDGSVHIRDDVPAKRFTEVLEHELNHVLKRKGYQPYLDFMARVDQTVDIFSDAGNRLLAKVGEYRHINLNTRINNDDIIIISDEIAALVRGAEMSGHVEDILGDLREAFDDYDAFASELAKIHEQYVKDVAEEKRREESKS